MLKEEKNERLNIKSDPPVQVNVAASCSKYSFIGSTHPFLWSAISNHAPVDKCTLVSFSIPSPGTANRTIIGLGCVWRGAPLLPMLGQWLLQAAHVPEGSKHLGGSSIPAPLPRLSMPNTPARRRRRLSLISCPAGAALLCLLEPSPSHLCHSMALSSLCSQHLLASWRARSSCQKHKNHFIAVTMSWTAGTEPWKLLNGKLNFFLFVSKLGKTSYVLCCSSVCRANCDSQWYALCK